MNILFFNTMLEYGGTQKVMMSLAAHFKDKGCNVNLVTMFCSKQMLLNFEDKYGLKIHNLQMKNEKNNFINPFEIVRGIIRLYKIIKRNKIEVMQTFGPFCNIIGIPIAYTSKVIKRIASHRNHPGTYKYFIQILDKLVCSSFLATKIVCVSNSIKEYCVFNQNIDAKKVVVINNGINKSDKIVDMQKVDDLKNKLNVNNHIIVLTVARLSEQKNHLFYLDVIKQIVKNYPDFKFIFVGDGPLKNIINQKIKKYKLSENILILKNRDDIDIILNIANIFVLPSLWEGISNALLESMSFGVPSIASDIPGNRELIQNNDTGILFDLSRHTHLQKSIIELSNDRKKQMHLSKRAVKHINENFSIDLCYKKYERLYS